MENKAPAASVGARKRKRQAQLRIRQHQCWPRTVGQLFCHLVQGRRQPERTLAQRSTGQSEQHQLRDKWQIQFDH